MSDNSLMKTGAMVPNVPERVRRLWKMRLKLDAAHIFEITECPAKDAESGRVLFAYVCEMCKQSVAVVKEPDIRDQLLMPESNLMSHLLRHKHNEKQPQLKAPKRVIMLDGTL